MNKRFGKTKFILTKLKEAWERGETTTFISGKYEFIEKQNIDKITQKLISMDWNVEPMSIEMEKYKKILESLPEHPYDEMILGKWVTPDKDE